MVFTTYLGAKFDSREPALDKGEIRAEYAHLRGRWVGCQRERRKGIHDKIHPEKLDSCKNRVHIWIGNSRNKCQQNGSNVDSELELEFVR